MNSNLPPLRKAWGSLLLSVSSAALLSCFTAPAVAQTTPTVAPSVFNVFSGGKITLGDTVNTQAYCNPGFYDSPQVNVSAANLLGTQLCKNSSSTNNTAAATTIATSGANVSRLTLPTYLSTANLLDVNYANSAQIIVNNGSTSTMLNGAGQLTVTSNSGGSTTSQTLTVQVQGSTLSLPAGEYAKVTTQAGGVLHFQGGSVATRIKQLNVANCNGSTMEFEPGDYYIETANWQQGCHLTVSPTASGNTATSVNLYFKNAFTLNAGPTCWNISGTCGSIMGSTQIQAQQPQKLKLYVYNGNFTTVQGAQIAAGIYVDQGDVNLTSANNFALIGEVFANNITSTNGGPAAFVYRQVLSTSTTGGGSGGGNTTQPTISMSPASGNFIAPASVSLTATATAASGNSISQVQFYQGTTLIATATTPTATNGSSYSVNWSNVTQGSYSITAKAMDNSGTASTSAPVLVNVTANGPKVYDIHSDQINTPRVITDANGNEVWRWDSAPFGETAPNEQPTTATSKFTFNFRFPGQYFDAETGLHYNYFRDYDPQAGRYVESDPIGLDGGINTFGYLGGNPISGTDPLGLYCRAVGNLVTCIVPGVDHLIWFPRPKDWPDYIGPESRNYHVYGIGMYDECVDPKDARKGVGNEPTPSSKPGGSNPATSEGTPNNADPVGLGPLTYSPVTSYLTPNGVVINVTQPGHPLHPGYVYREAIPNADGTSVVNIGEGLGAPQAVPYLSDLINNVWVGQTQGIFDKLPKKCGCKN